jgi:hypothetical protein
LGIWDDDLSGAMREFEGRLISPGKGIRRKGRRITAGSGMPIDLYYIVYIMPFQNQTVISHIF